MSTEQLQQEDKLKYLISVSSQLFIPTLYENIIKKSKEHLTQITFDHFHVAFYCLFYFNSWS